jgi:hypothetical protein
VATDRHPPMSPVSLMEASGLWDWCPATAYR